MFVERALLQDLGVRAGFVWKKDNDGWQRLNVLRPFEAYNVPVTIIDPGPDGNAPTTADNGPNIPAFNLDSTARGTSQVTLNVPGYEGTYKTFEIVREQAIRPALVDERVVLLHLDRGVREPLLQQSLRHWRCPAARSRSSEATRRTRTSSTLNEFTNWNAKFTGTIDAGWGFACHAGAQDRRAARRTAASSAATSTTTPRSCSLSSRSARGVRTRSRLSTSASRSSFGFAQKARVGPVPRYVQRAQLEHGRQHQLAFGRGFEKATTVLGPRIAKFGVKFDW